MNIINLNKSVSYYFLIILILFLFLISINFSLYYLKNLFKNLFTKIKNTKKDEVENFDNLHNESELRVNEKLIQEDLPFDKKPKDGVIKYKFKLPSVDFLKVPTKLERERNSSESKVDENTLEGFTVVSKKIDTIYGTERFSVEDYELIDDNRMILLLYEKNLSKGSKIVLTDSILIL